MFFFHLPRLEKLDISFSDLNQFEQDFRIELFRVSRSKLKELKISKCELVNSSSLKIFTSYLKLREICISYNNFLPFPENFNLGESKNTLNKILAISCGFQDKNVIKAIIDCKKLKYLILDQNYNLKKQAGLTLGLQKILRKS
jgi:hypothetical protein